MEKLTIPLEKIAIEYRDIILPGYTKKENRVFEISRYTGNRRFVEEKDGIPIQVLEIDTTTEVPQLKETTLSCAVDGVTFTDELEWQAGLVKVRQYCREQLMK